MILRLKLKLKLKLKKFTLDKINKKISRLNIINEKLAGSKANLTTKLDMIHEWINELQDEVYSYDSWLRLVELDKIDAILQEVFHTAWKMLNKNKNRINQ